MTSLLWNVTGVGRWSLINILNTHSKLSSWKYILSPFYVRRQNGLCRPIETCETIGRNPSWLGMVGSSSLDLRDLLYQHVTCNSSPEIIIQLVTLNCASLQSRTLWIFHCLSPWRGRDYRVISVEMMPVDCLPISRGIPDRFCTRSETVIEAGWRVSLSLKMVAVIPTYMKWQFK